MKYPILWLFTFFILINSSFAQNDSLYIAQHYDKTEYQIKMRDGVKLYTIVYTPKDKSKKYPILMKRTCYSIKPYGEAYATRLGPSKYLMKEGYIFVNQDVRGRWMSEGVYDNMRPHIPGNKLRNKKAIDESSDTYDTVDWLVKNIPNNNGKVGQYGISYPGFYTAAAIPEAHPALVASSPQAPISDFFFDDFHHMGAFLQSYLFAFPVFGHHKEKLTTESWYSDKWSAFNDAGDATKNGYEFYKDMGSIKVVKEKYFTDNFFWDQIISHPNYDEFWQKRSILPHLKEVDHAVMTVGGWFDAEDLYGPLNIYKSLEKNNPKMNNTIVMGPWSHGDWAREKGTQSINHIYFGDSISTFYQKEIERNFFNHYLKDEGKNKLPEAYMFDTGLNQWRKYDTWPPKKAKNFTLRFEEDGRLLIDQKPKKAATFTYMSDPDKPVPYRSEIEPVRFTPRPYMTDDQRHASYRPDVLTFETEILDNDLQLAGEIMAKLMVSISTSDADFVVKLIDVYPDDAPATKATPAHVNMGGYQQLVRAEVFRGRYRNSFTYPEPFTPNQPEEVTFPLQDILHTFKKGHRVMIQIHSTWFPYIDRNPQKYVDNIYEAADDDFIKSVITVHGTSSVLVGNLKEEMKKFEEMKSGKVIKP